MLFSNLFVVLMCFFQLTFGENLKYVLPDTFGNYTIKDLENPQLSSSCGTTMYTYNSIPAKSNGEYQGTGTSCAEHVSTGSQYQCVEYVQRYFNTKFGTTPNWYANANEMCSSYPSGISKTSSPKAGDAVVFNFGSYGHTAMIQSISGSNLNVVEQNASPTGQNTYSTSGVMCYLTHGGSSGACTHVGYYCGGDGLNKDVNSLYYCSGSGATPSLYKTCSFTCVTMPSGQDDTCSTSGTCSTVNTGYYCGSDKVQGDKNTLYLCESSKPYGARYCSNGCYTASSGSDDYCK